jgi:anti-sigma factor RsiW
MEPSPARCEHTPDAALYVIGELTGHDLDAFARHLQTCDECAEEVDLLEAAGDLVPLLAARHVPLEPAEPRIERHAPLLAAAAAQAKAEQQADQEERDESGKPILRALPGGTSTPEPVASVVSIYREGARSRLRLLRKPVPKPALVGLVLIAILAVTTLALSNRAASVRYIRKNVQAGWTTGGGAAIKLEGNQAQVLVDGMPLPVKGTGYEIWVVDKLTRQLRPTGKWLRPNKKGQAGTNVPGDYHDLAAIAVYLEPDKGPQTTHSGAVVVADMRNAH